MSRPELLDALEKHRNQVALLMRFAAAEQAGEDRFDRKDALGMVDQAFERIRAAVTELGPEKREQANAALAPLILEMTTRIQAAFMARSMTLLKAALSDVERLVAMCDVLREA